MGDAYWRDWVAPGVPADEPKRAGLTELERELLAALRRALPAAWLVATSGNPDAVAIHDEVRAAIAKAEGR